MKRGCMFLLAFVLTVGLCACSAGQKEEGSRFRLWFITNPSLGSVSLGTEEYSGAQTVPALVEALLAGPSAESGLVSPIPEGVSLQGWEQSSRAVQVDLSHPYNELSGVDLTLADYCIALTLTQLDGVDGVRITVNGVELPQRSRQLLRPGDVLFSGAEEEPVELIATLHFRRAGGNELGAELRIFRLTESESAALAVLQALVAGPQEEGLTALLPEAVTAYSAREENGICYADFSAELLEYVPEAEEEQQLVVRSIVDSLCSLGYVHSVQLMVEGQPLERYGLLDVSEPLS